MLGTSDQAQSSSCALMYMEEQQIALQRHFCSAAQPQPTCRTGVCYRSLVQEFVTGVCYRSLLQEPIMQL